MLRLQQRVDGGLVFEQGIGHRLHEERQFGGGGLKHLGQWAVPVGAAYQERDGGVEGWRHGRGH
ncbi:MAG: hypothetical protein DCC57_22715 [Chloroflexi bacterium]|nr:MAG: hypothetical protein DCC57_22715 [Chloroflexota bacterium]